MSIKKSSDIAESNEAASVGIKAVLILSDLWGLSEVEMAKMLSVSRATLCRLRESVQMGERVNLSEESLYRLSYILGIRKGVEMYYPRSRWNSYMRAPNRKLNGRSALDLMTSGQMDDLKELRAYLDLARQSPYL